MNDCRTELPLLPGRDEETLKSYNNTDISFGYLALYEDLDEGIIKSVLSDLFDRANREEENGGKQYIDKLSIVINMELNEPLADSNRNILTAYIQSGVYGYGYDIINLFAHEIGHVRHRRRIGEERFSRLTGSNKEKEANRFASIPAI